MYAIIETGSKQFKVSEGDVIRVEKLGAAAGDSYVFDKVIAVSVDGSLNIGAPFVSGASVEATVIGDGRAKKVIVYKYKPKKGFHKKKGHRQPFTQVKIERIIPDLSTRAKLEKVSDDLSAHTGLEKVSDIPSAQTKLEIDNADTSTQAELEKDNADTSTQAELEIDNADTSTQAELEKGNVDPHPQAELEKVSDD